MGQRIALVEMPAAMYTFSASIAIVAPQSIYLSVFEVLPMAVSPQ